MGDARKRLVELVAVQTADGIPLDGSYAPPDGEWNGTVVVVVHGKTGQFYTGPGRMLTDPLCEAGYACLSVNLRIHDLGYTRFDLPFLPYGQQSFSMGGAAWERLEDGPVDLDAWVGFARERNARRIALVGHSNGGLNVTDWAGRNAHATDLAALVLLSPLMSHRMMLPIWFDGEDGVRAALGRAHRMVDKGRGHELIPLRSWYWAISEFALIARAAEPPGLFDEAIQRLRIPLLMLYGSREVRGPAWDEVVERYQGPIKRRIRIEGAEHVYLGYETEVVEAVRRFLDSALVA